MVIDTPEWVARAKPVEAAAVDVGFLVSDSFYFGPENNFSPEQWKTLREPLYQPKLPRRDRYLLTETLTKPKSRKELFKYYADVIRLIGKYERPWVRQRFYFWVRPLIFWPGVFQIGFPWYDTWEEAKPLLAALEAEREGEIFSDLEQGWEVDIFASGSQLFLRQGDFDSKEEQECVSCDRGRLARQVPRLRDRCERLLSELCAQFGQDYWTRR